MKEDFLFELIIAEIRENISIRRFRREEVNLATDLKFSRFNIKNYSKCKYDYKQTFPDFQLRSKKWIQN